MSVGKNWVLVIQDGNSEETVVPVAASVLSIGRAVESDIRLASDGVSRNHAQLDLRGDVPVLMDRSSTNGTTLRGRKIKDASPLKSGDVFEIGRARLRLINVSHADPTTAELPQVSPPASTSQSIHGIKGNVQVGDGMQNDVKGDNYAIQGKGNIHADHSHNFAGRDSFRAHQQHFNDSHFDFEFPEQVAIRRGGLAGGLTILGLITALVGMCMIGYGFIVAFIATSKCTGFGCTQKEFWPLIGELPIWAVGGPVFVIGGVIYATGAVMGSVAESREKEFERRQRSRRQGGGR